MREKGFTLIELMVIVTILGIIAAMAVPSFSSQIKEQHLKSKADDYYIAFSYARAEAVRTSRVIEVIPLKDNDWTKGLIVKREDSAPGNNDGEQLRIVSGTNKLSIAADDNVVKVQYNGKGFVTGLTSGGNSFASITMDFCDGVLTKDSRQLRILSSGFAAVKTRVGC